MNKNIFKCLMVVVFMLALTGCGNNSTVLENGNKLESKGNCVATECIKQITTENTVEEINQIIGFEGTLTDEKYDKYYWELSSDSGVEVTYYGSNKGTIKLTIDRNVLANSNVDLSAYDEIKSQVNSGITYDEFVKKVGNVQGTLIEKSDSSMKYVWVDGKGNYLNGTFSNRTGECTIVTGLVK